MSNSSMPISDLQAAPSLKFDEVGDRHKGVIQAIEKRQSTDMDTGTPLTWPDGRPRMYTSITLTVDGEDRTVNGAGGNFEVAQGQGTSFEAALVTAAKAAGASSIDAGATLEIVLSGLGKKPSAGKNAPKLWSMKYTPGNKSMAIGGEAGGAGLFSEEEG